MGALKTCCGLYCSLTSLVGVYFFIVVEDDMELPGGKYQAVDDREPG